MLNKFNIINELKNNLRNLKSNNEKFILIIAFFLLISLFFVSVIWSLTTGSIDISLQTIINSIGHLIWNTKVAEVDVMNVMVINEIRLPRMILAFIVGAALSITGGSMQGLFRNPLADPALIGVSTGAALGAVIFIILGSYFFPDLPSNYKTYIIPVFAFLGGILSTILAYKLATRSGVTNISILLLSGIALNAVNGSIYGFFLFIANDAQLRNITFWSLGSFSGTNWISVQIGFFVVFLPSLLLFLVSNKLNILALGEKEAYYLGINVQKLKVIIILITAITIGGAVSLSGIIGFVGLVTPHIIRLWFTNNYKHLIPLSFLAGGILLMIADTFARTIVSPAELPIGIITTGIGGPFFIWLLLKEKRKDMMS